METQLIPGGLYRHYKGMLYRVHNVVVHSETLEELVHYETLYENPRGRFWVRPKKMFLENIELDGVIRPRFEYLPESPR